MNRRKFLQKGTGAFAAIAALPLLMQRKQQTVDYNDYEGPEIDEGGVTVMYTMSIIPGGFKQFATTTDANKKLKLTRLVLDKTTLDVEKKEVSFYKIKSSVLIDNQTSKYFVNASFIKEDEGVRKPFKAMGSKIKINIVDLKGVEVLDVMDKAGYKMDYVLPEKSNCFLTSACVHHKGLPDDCDELTTLRKLRDNFMTASKAGKGMIGDYYTAGPKIVKAIREAENRSEILDYLYDHLVQPSVNMIKQGQEQRAVDYYAAFVTEMKRKYIS